MPSGVYEHKKHSEETKKKISITQKNNLPLTAFKKGHIVSAESRKKASEAHKGKHHSDETKKKLSKINKGKIISEESKKKMRDSAKKAHREYSFGFKKGHIMSVTTRKKISIGGKKAHKKYTFGFKKGHPYLRLEGFKHSEASKKKMSDVHKGVYPSEETKKKRGISIKKAHEKKSFGFLKGRIASIEERERSSIRMQGKNNPAWIDGKRKDGRGYILVHSPNHPFRNNSGCVREQRLVGESQIGRYLKPEEVVHHINKIKDDNSPKNLIAFASHSAHIRFHKDPNNVKPEEIIFNGDLI